MFLNSQAPLNRGFHHTHAPIEGRPEIDIPLPSFTSPPRDLYPNGAKSKKRHLLVFLSSERQGRKWMSPRVSAFLLQPGRQSISRMCFVCCFISFFRPACAGPMALDREGVRASSCVSGGSSELGVREGSYDHRGRRTSLIPCAVTPEVDFRPSGYPGGNQRSKTPHLTCRRFHAARSRF